jgi:protein-disulfide isomerase
VCDQKTGAFLQFHDALFSPAARLDERDSFLTKTAADLKLNSQLFEGCMARPGEEVIDDVALAATLGIRSTPVFLVGTIVDGGLLKVERILPGAVTFGLLSGAIEDVGQKGRR